MSYSWDEFVVAHEYLYEEWTAMVTEPSGGREKASREYHRLKANEIVYPDRYRNIRLMKRTTTVFSWEDVSP